MRGWMDCSENIRVGEMVFCAELYDGNNATERLDASRTPYSKNMSGEKILRGWCGSTNNMNVHAIGAGIVRRLSERMDDDGEPMPRCQVERLPDTDPRVVSLCDELDVTTK